MSGLVKTIALASTLGLGYVTFRYFNATKEPESKADEPDDASSLTSTSTSRTTTTATTATGPTVLPRPGSTPPGPPAGTGNGTKPTGVMAPFQILGEMFESREGPQAPLDPPNLPRAKSRWKINESKCDDTGTVIQSPTQLLAEARKYDAAITLDELTGARLAASEHGSGSFTELCCIVDGELNRAERKGKSLHKSLTYRDTFGRQGKTRRASTRQDPTLRHLLAARAVLSGKARGISRGAVQFFDPEAMDRLNAKVRLWREGKAPKPAHAPSCDALGLLEAWCFDYGRLGKTRCPPDRGKRGNHTLAWVGPIPGVDPFHLMLMKRMPPGTEHTLRYQAARELITERRKKK